MGKATHAPPDIRRAAPADLATVMSILHETTHWHEWRGIKQWRSYLSPAAEQDMRQHIVEDEVYVAWIDGASAGTFLLQWSDDEYWGEAGADGQAAYVHALAVRRVYAGL